MSVMSLLPGDLALAVVGNVSSRPIDVALLVCLLRAASPPRDWAGPLAAFFCELPVPSIIRFLEDNGVSRSEARRAYRSATLEAGGRSARLEAWLDEP